MDSSNPPAGHSLDLSASAASNNDIQSPSSRRSSFSFLRRKSTSADRIGQRTLSASKMSRKQKALAQEEALRKQREAAMLPREPPRLPSHAPLPTIANFGGEHRPDSVAIISNKVSNFNFSRPSAPVVDQRRAPPPAASLAVMPPLPSATPSVDDVDPYARTESMTHRGRYSYAPSAVSSVNTPRRVRRRKDPTPFNILVLGAKGSGKSTFIEFLRTALVLPARKRGNTPSPPPSAVAEDSAFTSQYLETEIEGERIGVTLWDSEGLEKNAIDFQLPTITSFLESKFEETFSEEQKVVRSPGVRDTHIHCAFLLLDPTRLDTNIADARKRVNAGKAGTFGGLDESLDLNVLRELQTRTTVIPVVSKADTITGAHMRYLKKTVWDTIKRAKLDPLDALNLDEYDEQDDMLDERDEDAYVDSDQEGKSDVLEKVLGRTSSEAARSVASANSSPAQSPPSTPRENKRHSRRMSAALSVSMKGDDSPFLPLSIISPDPYEPDVIGRKFPWGFADPYNPEHCDFEQLKESVFSEWRSELREASREQWYENWRTSRLENGGNTKSSAASIGRTSAGSYRPYRPENAV